MWIEEELRKLKILRQKAFRHHKGKGNMSVSLFRHPKIPTVAKPGAPIDI